MGLIRISPTTLDLWNEHCGDWYAAIIKQCDNGNTKVDDRLYVLLKLVGLV